MKRLLFILLISTLLLGCNVENDRYNILLIAADDMNEYGFLHSHSQGLTLVPMEIALKNGSVQVRAKDPYYAHPSYEIRLFAFGNGEARFKNFTYKEL